MPTQEPQEPARGPRILTLDIETSPNLAYVWGLFNQNVSLSQLAETGHVMAFAAKWHPSTAPRGQRGVIFRSDHHDGHETMVQAAHDLLDAADIVVTYNGPGFDLKHLRREFLLAGLTPPSPWQDVDLLRTARSQFRFTSNKLDHVAQQLGLGAKTGHTGFQLWLDCLAGDDAAWRLMRRYNRQDVLLTEALYDRVRPWIKGHPHLGLFTADPEAHVCGNCGSDAVTRRGYARTTVGRYRRYQCQSCGRWSRGKRRLDGVDVRPAA